MRKRIFLSVLVLVVVAQTKAQEGPAGSASLEWLKKNLTFNYFNPDQGKWWLNKMEFDAVEGTIHVQNASAVNPKKFREKSWIDRRVNLSQLDPYSIAINPVLENKGRIVKGSVLIVDVIHNEKKIRKSLDGRQATPESFLQFSIPSSLSDSVSGFADSLKFHLVQAIETQSMISNKNVIEENKTLIFKVLRGEFISGSVTRTYTPLFKDMVEIEERLGAKPLRKGYFGYDNSKSLFFEVMVSDEGPEIHYYEVSGEAALKLVSQPDTSVILHLESLLHFSQVVNGVEKEYRRLSY